MWVTYADLSNPPAARCRKRALYKTEQSSFLWPRGNRKRLAEFPRRSKWISSPSLTHTNIIHRQQPEDCVYYFAVLVLHLFFWATFEICKVRDTQAHFNGRDLDTHVEFQPRWLSPSSSRLFLSFFQLNTL